MKYANSLISIVIPSYNEADSIDELFSRIVVVFDSLCDYDYEVILVNDGSLDSTTKIISEINSNKLIEIKLKTNLGKSAAIMSGFAYATGMYIITMDADLQDIPEDIPKFINKIKNGYDLVTGYRINRKDSLLRKFGSRIVNFFLRINSGLKIREHNCGFKIYTNQLAKSLFIYGHLHRFIPLIAHSKGYKVSEIGTNNNARKHGNSKYKAVRYEALFDYISLLYITRQSTTPLHVFGKLSLLLIIPSIIIILYLLINHILFLLGNEYGAQIVSRPILFFAFFMIISGISIFMSGLICEFILYHYSSDKKNYLIQENIEYIRENDSKKL